jgi:hypothetical protein
MKVFEPPVVIGSPALALHISFRDTITIQAPRSSGATPGFGIGF